MIIQSWETKGISLEQRVITIKRIRYMFIERPSYNIQLHSSYMNCSVSPVCLIKIYNVSNCIVVFEGKFEDKWTHSIARFNFETVAQCVY